jgi:hypothetical protein
MRTSPEIGEDYWTTALIPVVEKRAYWGLVRRAVPDFYHPVATWTRNSRDDAYQVHAEVRAVVISTPEDEWFDAFPPPAPPDGYSEGAKARLRKALGDDALIEGRQSRRSPVTDSIEKSLRAGFLKSSDEINSQFAAEEIVYAFLAHMEERTVACFRDERTLPYPRDMIKLAFRKRISFYEARCRKDPTNAEFEKDLWRLRDIAMYVADYMTIDPDDEEIVRAINVAMQDAVGHRRCITKGTVHEERLKEFARRSLDDEWRPVCMKYEARKALQHEVEIGPLRSGA